jgi:hypothetical protein
MPISLRSRALLSALAAIGFAAALAVETGPAASRPGPSSPVSAVQTRCGWIVNPTPANWWLNDADGEWELGSQGGYQAPGLDTLPDLTEGEWVVTNGSSYGYGCGCLKASVDRKRHRIARVHSFRQKPLRICRGDRHLRKPG